MLEHQQPNRLVVNIFSKQNTILNLLPWLSRMTTVVVEVARCTAGSVDRRLSVNSSSGSKRVSESTLTLRQTRPSVRGNENWSTGNDKRWFSISTKSKFSECMEIIMYQANSSIQWM